jgi:hypothetical protein
MAGDFSVQTRKSNGNLHLRPQGDLDGSSAWVLIHAIRKTYAGTGRVFIDTQDLREIHPFGCGVFKCEIRKGLVPSECLFFKGKKGFDIAPNGSRVLITAKNPSCRCDGNCENCQCQMKKRQRLV